MTSEEIARRRIILFDGVCNLCNASVVFILQREREPVFEFASIQSEAGQWLLAWCGLPGDYNEAVILIDHGRVFSGSTAGLRIGQNLKFPWSLLSYVSFLIPRSVRDVLYKHIARHRYRWFGKRDVCMVPTSNLKSRFLD